MANGAGPMRIKLLKHYWTVVRRPLRVHDGTCDPLKRRDRTHARGREIVIDSGLHGVKELEITCHELMHGCAWEVLAEDVVERCSRKFADTAWRFGCRRHSCRATDRHGLKDLEHLLCYGLGGYVWKVAGDDWVKNSSRDIVRALYRLGWRFEKTHGQ